MPLSVEEKSAISRVAKTIIVDRVLLHSTDCLISNGFGPESKESLQLQTQFGVADGNDLAAHESELIAGSNIEVAVFCKAFGSVKEGENEGEEKLKLTAEFYVRYRILSNDFRLSDFVQFVRHNTLHTVVPYWREYSSSVCQRMGISPVPVPFFLGTDPVEEKTNQP